jgi:hypothetical protein
MLGKSSALLAPTAELSILSRRQSAGAVEPVGADAGWRAGMQALVQNVVTDYPRKSSWTVVRVRPAWRPARHNDAE